ncbi:hypothetical protein SCB71_14590 [Herbiconiux sp. KACC 21604]|uniref:hypothetical protein n=1 Tax=unclassified Herbiconiux TaxID=2618217 RepID=UPI001492E3E0|nr:hypothetical protein [Herbiconiux sp. SALV-R1]QJU54370.1 hypothetical protein HL652_12530 [Herbiconiux sp. SALV-R1]WPO85441.1 hypothetical protein SCB71_14590 [Herbiconiux sp. KACC 21604]
MSTMTQAAFDFDELTRAPYDGPELRYHCEPLDPDVLVEIETEQRRAHGNFGIAVGKPHLWLSANQGPVLGEDGHVMVEFRADLRCDHHAGQECLCVGDLVYRGYCSCGWVSPIVTYGMLRRAWDESHGRHECWLCKGTGFTEMRTYVGNVLQPPRECWVCARFEFEVAA